MQGKGKLVGISVFVTAVALSSLSYVYSHNLTLSVILHTNTNPVTFTWAGGTTTSQNYYIPTGILSFLGVGRNPARPSGLCAGQYPTDGSSVPQLVTAMGWPVTYAYATPPLICGTGDYDSYLPIAFLLNVGFYITIGAAVYLARKVVIRRT